MIREMNKIATGSSLDGPAIAICPYQKAMELDAKVGSEALLKAIRRAGVRP